MGWKLKNCYGEVNCMVTTSYQLKFGSNWTRHIACRGSCYKVWSHHTLYFALLCASMLKMILCYPDSQTNLFHLLQALPLQNFEVTLIHDLCPFRHFTRKTVIYPPQGDGTLALHQSSLHLIDIQ